MYDKSINTIKNYNNVHDDGLQNRVLASVLPAEKAAKVSIFSPFCLYSLLSTL